MAQEVALLAAAPGWGLRFRDGMIDIDIRDIGLELIKGRDAGNAAVIDPGGGWETQYSHLRQGSIMVKPGDQMSTGDVLGIIGMSGRAEFPMWPSKCATTISRSIPSLARASAMIPAASAREPFGRPRPWQSSLISRPD